MRNSAKIVVTPYILEAEIEAGRLEKQANLSNYSVENDLRRFRFSPDEKILDAGCGSGVLSRYLVEKRGVKNVDAMDFSDMRLKQASRLAGDSPSIHFHRQDLAHLESDFHNRYDTIICRYVIEHSEHPSRILTELRKALKPGGRLIIIEADGVFFNLYTPNETFNAYMAEFKSKLRFDLEIGRKVPDLMKSAGLTDLRWEAELMCFKGKSLEEEYENTKLRFAASRPVMVEILGSTEKCDDFQRLYLQEMMKEENTLVFTKYICSGRRRD